MKINCEEAGHICTRAQYKEATIWEIIKLNFHTLTCKVCAKYSRKNGTFTKLCDKADLQVLSEEDKKRLKEVLEKNG